MVAEPYKEHQHGGSLLERARRGGWLLTFPLVAAALLWPCLSAGDVLVPARLLPYFPPWSSLRGAGDLVIPWNPLMWDGVAQFYPWRLFAARSVAEGYIPLWNPHQFCGTPFLANSQSAPLYPLHLLLYLPLGVGIAQRLVWLTFIHLSLAGAFTALWAGSLGARRSAATLAGVLFMASGFAVTWLQLPSVISVACWIPLLLYTTGRLWRQPSWGWALGSGLALGMLLLGGHLQIAFYGLMAAALQLLWHLGAVSWAIRPARRKGATTPVVASQLRALVLAGLLAGVVGAALSAAQLLPSLELSRYSHRSSAPTESGYTNHYLRLAMTVDQLVTLFFPDFYGHPLDGTYHGPGNYAEYSPYVGMAGLALALLGALMAARLGHRAVFLVVLAGLALMMALGGSPNRLLYFGIPGFNQSGSPNRILVLFCLSMAVLAGLGAEVVLRAREQSRLAGVYRQAVCVAGALVVGLFVLQLLAEPVATARARELFDRVPGASPVNVLLGARDAAVSRAWVLLVVGVGIPTLLMALMAQSWFRWKGAEALLYLPVAACVAFDLLSFSTSYNARSSPPDLVYPETPFLRQVQLATRGARMAVVNNRWGIERAPRALFPPNAAIPYRLMDAQGYDSLYLGSYKTLVNTALGEDASPPENGNIVFIRRADPATCALLGVRWLLTVDALSGQEYRLAAEGEGCLLYEVMTTPPPTRFVTRALSLEPGPLPLHMINSARENPQVFASTAWLTPGLRGPVLSPGQARWSSPGPGRRDIDVESPGGGLVLITENYSKGWRAVWESASGSTSPLHVWRANYTFQAVPVPAGRGHVRLSYEPASFRVGLFLSLLALGVSTGGGAFALRTMKRGWPKPAPSVNCLD